MINIKKLKHNSLLDDFDLLTEFARTDTRKEINLDTELPELNDINCVSTSQTPNIKIYKINSTHHQNNLQDDFKEDDFKEDITNDFKEDDFKEDDFKEDDFKEKDFKEDITNDFKEDITNDFKEDDFKEKDFKEDDFKEVRDDIENILTNKFMDKMESSNKLVEESVMNFDPTESIMEDLEFAHMDNYKSDILKREYHFKSKKQKVFNKQDINNIYRYLIKYRIKIKKKLLKKNIINENLDCSDKLLFSLYLNLLFNDIILE